MSAWQAWLQKGEFTDWVQAIASVAALFVAYVSLRISRRAIDISVNSFVRPIEIRPNDGNPEILVKNVGVHIVYNIEIITTTFTSFKDIKWIKADGQQDLNANETALFNLRHTSSYAFNHRYPIIIKYELASGRIRKNRWYYLMGKRTSIKFIHINWMQGLIMKLRFKLSLLKLRFIHRKNKSEV